MQQEGYSQNVHIPYNDGRTNVAIVDGNNLQTLGDITHTQPSAQSMESFQNDLAMNSSIFSTLQTRNDQTLHRSSILNGGVAPSYLLPLKQSRYSTASKFCLFLAVASAILCAGLQIDFVTSTADTSRKAVDSVVDKKTFWMAIGSAAGGILAAIISIFEVHFVKVFLSIRTLVLLAATLTSVTCGGYLANELKLDCTLQENCLVYLSINLKIVACAFGFSSCLFYIVHTVRTLQDVGAISFESTSNQNHQQNNNEAKSTSKPWKNILTRLRMHRKSETNEPAVKVEYQDYIPHNIQGERVVIPINPSMNK